MFLGENLIEWLLLALGGAMALGNLAALIRPPNQLRSTDLERTPLWRCLTYMAIGVVVVVWALAGLTA